MLRAAVVFALSVGCLHAAAADSFNTQWRLVLPWADPPSDQATPPAVYGGDRIITFAGLEEDSWTLVATAATGPTAGQLLWTTKLPLSASLPSVVAVAGALAVVELDGRVFAVHPGNGSIAWNATSPCSLGDPRMVNSRDVYEAVYLVCNELSGDSTIIALSPANGTATWTLSTSSLAAKLTPVRAAAAADGMFVYADTGSTITALSSSDGALLWQVDVGRLPSTTITTTATHLLLAGDVLLVREFSAGLQYSDGPFSYLALQLNGTQPPSLLWAAGSPEQRDRLPTGVTEVSPFVAPALSLEDDLFYYWSAAVVQAFPPPPSPPLSPPAPPTSPPLPAPMAAPAPAPSPAAGMAVQWIEGGDGTTAPVLSTNSTAVAEERGTASSSPADGATSLQASQAGTSSSSGAALGRRLTQAAASNSTADATTGLVTGSSSDPSTVDLVVQAPPAAAAPPAPAPAVPGAAPEPAPAPAPGAAASPNATAVVPPETPGVAVETGGVGVVAPEGLVSFPLLKARSISTGEEVWSLQLQPVSAPSAAEGAVAVVTPDGLVVLDAGSGEMVWAVDQKPIGIYPYAPALVAADAAAVRNCLNTLASNSLCIYSQASREGGAGGGEGTAPALSQPSPALAAGLSGTSGAVAPRAAAVGLLACAAAVLLLL